MRRVARATERIHDLIGKTRARDKCGFTLIRHLRAAAGVSDATPLCRDTLMRDCITKQGPQRALFAGYPWPAGTLLVETTRFAILTDDCMHGIVVRWSFDQQCEGDDTYQIKRIVADDFDRAYLPEHWLYAAA